MRRGFTLLELLVVIAIIVLLIGILLPALGEARRSGWRSVSLANLHSNVQFMAVYANENHDQFINPFDTEKPCPDALNTAVIYVPQEPGIPPCSHYWIYANGGTEPYGYRWLSHTLHSWHAYGPTLKSNVHPADYALLEQFREKDLNLSPSGAHGKLDWVFPTSYWYPPVFWMRSDRFSEDVRPNAGASNGFFVRRNHIADVPFPDRKVNLFESKDYASKGQPMYNNVTAKPQMAFVDGSARMVPMADVYLQTSEPGQSEPGKLPFPSGKWNSSAAVMNNYKYGVADGFEWEYGLPGFFWATRDGLQGRDIR